MRTLSTAMCILFFILAGCAERKVVTMPETPPAVAEEKPATPAPELKSPAEEPAQAVETEKVTEQEGLRAPAQEGLRAPAQEGQEAPAQGEKKAEQEAAEETLKTVAEANSLCSGETVRATYDSIYFDFDRYDIRADAGPALKELSSWLARNDVKLHIEGHCDERGTNEYNLALGDQRAKSVRDYIMSMGIKAGRLEAVSCGEERPACPEQTEECLAKNRRAHFVILKEAAN